MIIKAKESDIGCYVDGHWGQYGTAHMIIRATEFGYEDQEVIDLAQNKMDSMLPNPTYDFSESEEEKLIYASDEVENWLNENVAEEGHSFGWYDGEFFYQSSQWWEEG